MDALSRTIMTLSCRDCDAIPKVDGAGRIVEEADERVQIMHNGLRVVAGGYHGDWMAQVIRGLRGHHEPQEELAFHALLRFVRHGSLVVELGAFWSYYAMWYLNEVPGSRALCVEPDPHNDRIGRRNCTLNAMDERMTRFSAWVGGEAQDRVTMTGETTGEPVTLPMIDMAALGELVDGAFIELLHVDAQGAETPFLRSMDAAMSERVRFLVVSTHHPSISGSPSTHGDCVEAVRERGGHVLLEHDVEESFSGDGLLVASFLAQDRAIVLPPVSRNRAADSLFGRR